MHPFAIIEFSLVIWLNWLNLCHGTLDFTYLITLWLHFQNNGIGSWISETHQWSLREVQEFFFGTLWDILWIQCDGCKRKVVGQKQVRDCGHLMLSQLCVSTSVTKTVAPSLCSPWPLSLSEHNLALFKFTVVWHIQALRWPMQSTCDISVKGILSPNVTHWYLSLLGHWTFGPSNFIFERN